MYNKYNNTNCSFEYQWCKEDIGEPEEVSSPNIHITGGNASLCEYSFSDFEQPSLVDPFELYVKKMRAFLGADPDVTVLSDSKAKVINIAVAGCNKPEAYRRFFPGTRTIKGIGEVKILINGHDKTYVTHCDVETLKAMLANHPLVKEIKVSYNNNKTINRIFVIFKNQTVQFKSDDWSSPWCVTTTVAEDLARIVMKGSGMVILWVTDSEFSLAEHTPEHP